MSRYRRLFSFLLFLAAVALGVWALFPAEDQVLAKKRGTGAVVTPIPTQRPSEAILPLRRVDAPRVASALPPANTPLKPILPDLKAQATGGNTRAACRLAFELDRCAKRGGPLCEGVSSAEAGEAWRYLLQAARAGHVPSMARFANGVTLMGDERQMSNVEGLMALRQEGPAFMQRALDAGYPHAYELARFVYMDGQLWGVAVKLDRVKALAHAMALGRIGTPAEVDRLGSVMASSIRQHGIVPADVAKARAQSEPLAAKLLERYAPGSVDFTRGTYAGDDGTDCDK